MKIKFDDLNTDKKEEILQEEITYLENEDKEYWEKRSQEMGYPYSEFIRNVAVMRWEGATAEMGC